MAVVGLWLVTRPSRPGLETVVKCLVGRLSALTMILLTCPLAACLTFPTREVMSVALGTSFPNLASVMCVNRVVTVMTMTLVPVMVLVWLLAVATPSGSTLMSGRCILPRRRL